MIDFEFRKKTRLRYPGACSLEYQSIIQIVLECLFQWDPKQQKAKGPGIFGTLLLFAPADEEQGRLTLHRHWQLWTKEIDQTLRRNLFHKDPNIRKETRSAFYAYIDNVMSASFDEDLVITHHCEDLPDSVTRIISDSPCGQVCQISDQVVRDARCKELSRALDGQILQCKKCDAPLSTIDVINLSLNRWRAHSLRGTRRQLSERIDTRIPVSGERIDIASYTYSYHMEGGCERIDDPFWGDPKIRKALLTLRFDEHDARHRNSCFKKGCECRFFFPFTFCGSTRIHEDRGHTNEHVCAWHHLDGTVSEIAPWLIMPKRPMGCQYINVHNNVMQEVLNCNTNVQIGDPTQIYYNTLYNSKSTQADDAERQRRVGNTISRRLLRIQEEIELGVRDPTTHADNFVEGLCRLLGGMNAATSRDVISAPMGHLLVSSRGTRFQFSHDFSHLLISQLEATLEGEPIDCRIRVSTIGKEKVTWPDSSSDDYIDRPMKPLFDGMCPYEFTMKYKKAFNTVAEVKRMESRRKQCANENSDDNQYHRNNAIVRHSFAESHPGYKFSHLTERKLQVIPIVCMPRGKLGRIEDLDLRASPPTEEVSITRENYAKMALLLFYPFRKLEDLQMNDSYWMLFRSELNSHLRGEATTFWKKGFTILQNIQDRYTLEKKLHRARDPITLNTRCGTSKVDKQPTSKEVDENQYPDISEFTTSQDRM